MATAIQETLPGFERFADSYPKTHNIEIDFEWVRVDYILTLPSIDFEEQGLSTRYNRESKESDPGYRNLVESIREDGFMDPIFLYDKDTSFQPGTEMLGNGHHRVCAALELGYTYIPVTRDDQYQWEESGPLADTGE
jgi:ParB-like nuclease domain